MAIHLVQKVRGQESGRRDSHDSHHKHHQKNPQRTSPSIPDQKKALETIFHGQKTGSLQLTRCNTYGDE